MSTTVVNLTKGETSDVYIGRASSVDDGYFGNPFMILDSGKEARFDAIIKFHEYFVQKIKTDPAFAQNVEGLRGKRLGCFCAPAPCHGDIYVGYLEGTRPDYLEEAMARAKAKTVVEAALDNKELMAQVVESHRLEEAGDSGTPWEENDPYEIEGRLENDAYYTPEPFVTELLARVPYIGGVVLEPCAGDGAISRVLEAYTPPLPEPIEVWTNDIDPKAGEHDFYLDAVLPAVFEQVQPDWVVTNPPYKSDILPEIVKNALEFAHVGVAMLMRLSFLEPTIERNSWFVENPPDLLIVTPRFSFKRNGKTDSVTTAWFVWYNQERAPAADWRVQGNSMEWPKGIQIMPRSVLDGVK